MDRRNMLKSTTAIVALGSNALGDENLGQIADAEYFKKKNGSELRLAFKRQLDQPSVSSPNFKLFYAEMLDVNTLKIESMNVSELDSCGLKFVKMIDERKVIPLLAKS